MGDFKPLLTLQSKTLIEHTIDSLLDGGVSKVIVVLGHRSYDVQVILDKKYKASRVEYVLNPDYAHTDMLTSVKIGIRSLPPCNAFFILPGDIPAIKSSTVKGLIEMQKVLKADVLLPVMNKKRTHPPLISTGFAPNILNFQEDGGLRAIWQKYSADISEIDVDDIGCTLDNDTREDFIRTQKYVESIKGGHAT